MVLLWAISYFQIKYLKYCRMLKDQPNEGLLGEEKNEVNKSSLRQELPMKMGVQEGEARQAKVSRESKKGKNHRSEVTYILKALNLIVGISYIGFAGFYYYEGNEEENLQNRGMLLRYLMPGYIGLSGLIIVLIECRIGFFIRNMRFLYNYFGRGLFNLYAGGMPAMMITKWDGGMNTLDIISLVASAVMILVGLLYIFLKCCCCEKEGREIDKLNRAEDSD